MSDWKPISVAPTTGRIDIWAKRWIPKTDEFEYRRFADCFWRSTHFSGVPKEWHPTHWLPAPEPPSEDALLEDDNAAITEHRRRWESDAA